MSLVKNESNVRNFGLNEVLPPADARLLADVNQRYGNIVPAQMVEFYSTVTSGCDVMCYRRLPDDFPNEKMAYYKLVGAHDCRIGFRIEPVNLLEDVIKRMRDRIEIALETAKRKKGLLEVLHQRAFPLYFTPGTQMVVIVGEGDCKGVYSLDFFGTTDREILIGNWDIDFCEYLGILEQTRYVNCGLYFFDAYNERERRKLRASVDEMMLPKGCVLPEQLR